MTTPPPPPPQAEEVAAVLEATWAAQPDLPRATRGLVEALDDPTDGRVGRYRVVRRLGEGEFATVFACTVDDDDDAECDDDDDDIPADDHNERRRRRRRRRREPSPDPTTRKSRVVAVKAITKAKVQRHANVAKSKRNIRRVNTEVLAMRRCAHAGICVLYDVLHSPTHVYVVMEMGDRDLFAFLDDHPDGCPELVMKSIARILALALRHCHNKGIAHRDIKPENILIQGSPAEWHFQKQHHPPDDDLRMTGIVKLCDFGLCAVSTPGRPAAALVDFVGSPGFFAPELMTRRHYDGRVADMWSLGAVMVEMCLGHQTFDALWCPPYEHLGDVHAFSSGIVDAVQAVKAGATTPPSAPVRQLLEDLLQVEPERRATIEQICTASWFELLRPTPEGYMQLLRLTFDHGYSDGAPSSPRRTTTKSRRLAYRETPREADCSLRPLSSLQSLASDPNLVRFNGGAPRSPLYSPPPGEHDDDDDDLKVT